MKQWRHSQSGQVGVIILLIMVVLLTLGLSLASRSSQQVYLSTQQAESTRVFNAAEAGIESALSASLEFQGQTMDGTLDDFSGTGIDVNYSVTKVNQLETRLFEMLSVPVDVTGAQDGDQITIDWSKENDCATQGVASLVMSIYNQTAGVSTARHQAWAGCDRLDGFASAQNIDDTGYRRRTTLTLQAGDQLVRVKPIYHDTHLRVLASGWTLPVQYYHIRSQAVNPDGNETRIVEVNRTLAGTPSVMDFALMSGSTIVK